MDLDAHKSEIMTAIRQGHATRAKSKALGWLPTKLDEDTAWKDVTAALQRFQSGETMRSAAASDALSAQDLKSKRGKLVRLSATADKLRCHTAALLDDRVLIEGLMAAAYQAGWADGEDDVEDILSEYRAAVGSLAKLTKWLDKAAASIRPASGTSPLSRLMQIASPIYLQHTGARARQYRPSEGSKRKRVAGGPYVQFVCACAGAAGLTHDGEPYRPEGVASALKRLRNDHDAEWSRLDAWTPPGEVAFVDHIDILTKAGHE